MLAVVRDYWRDPSYLSSRFAINVLAGLFIGFSFWRLSFSIADLQKYVRLYISQSFADIALTLQQAVRLLLVSRHLYYFGATTSAQVSTKPNSV